MKKQPSKVAHNSQPAIFFITGLAAQKAHFRQKYKFYRLSVSPLYNLLGTRHIVLARHILYIYITLALLLLSEQIFLLSFHFITSESTKYLNL